MSAESLRTDVPICQWPSGWRGNLRHSVVDNIVRNEAGTHVLLAWRAKKEIEGDKWALIGGYVDLGQTAILAALAETKQEAAQAAQNVAVKGLFRILDDPNRRNEKAQNVSFVFVSEVPNPEAYGEIEVDDPDKGVSKAKWFPLDELPSESEMAFDHHQVLSEFRADPTLTPLSVFMSGPEKRST